MTGVGEMLKLARPETKIVVAEPANASLLSGKPFTPHKIQGWTPDFIPAVLNPKVADRILPVSGYRRHRHRTRSWRSRKAFSAAFPAAPHSLRRCRLRANPRPAA